MPPVEKLPPQNQEAEEAVLGAILIDPDAIHRIRPIICLGTYFASEKKNWIYESMCALSDRGAPIDFLTVCDELDKRKQLAQVGGPAYVTTLVNAVPSSLHAEYYAHQVEDSYVRRRGLAIAGNLARQAYEAESAEDFIAYANKEVLDLELHQEGDGPQPIQRVVSEFYDDMERWANDPLEPGGVRGISTGIKDWDQMVGGMTRGETLAVLAARPRTGKTALALYSSYCMAQQGYHVLFFALEMKKRTLVARLASAEAKVSYKKIQRGMKEGSDWYASQEEWAKYLGAIDTISKARGLYIDDTHDLSPADIRVRSMQIARKVGGLDLIVVDTGNLVRYDRRNGMNFAQTESEKVRHIRNLIKELDCVGYVTWQLNKGVDTRNAENFGRAPTLADLRDTGGVEEHASDVFGLYRDELHNKDTKYKNVMHILGLKRRNDEGDTMVALGYEEAYQWFFRVDVNAREIM